VKKKGPEKIKKKDLEKVRKNLLDERERIHNDLRQIQSNDLKLNPRDYAGEISGLGVHIADTADQEYNRGFSLNLLSSKQAYLNEIEMALDKIDEGTFGICEMCEGPISGKRLKAHPAATHCLECREKMEEEEEPL